MVNLKHFEGIRFNNAYVSANKMVKVSSDVPEQLATFPQSSWYSPQNFGTILIRNIHNFNKALIAADSISQTPKSHIPPELITYPVKNCLTGREGIIIITEKFKKKEHKI